MKELHKYKLFQDWRPPDKTQEDVFLKKKYIAGSLCIGMGGMMDKFVISLKIDCVAFFSFLI